MPPLAAPHPEPLTFTDIELCTAGMHKVELSKRVLLMQMAVFLQCHTAVGACFDNGEAVELSPPVRHGMGYRDCGWPEDYDLLLPLRGLPGVGETTLSARSISLILRRRSSGTRVLSTEERRCAASGPNVLISVLGGCSRGAGANMLLNFLFILGMHDTEISALHQASVIGKKR